MPSRITEVFWFSFCGTNSLRTLYCSDLHRKVETKWLSLCGQHTSHLFDTREADSTWGDPSERNSHSGGLHWSWLVSSIQPRPSSGKKSCWYSSGEYAIRYWLKCDILFTECFWKSERNFFFLSLNYVANQSKHDFCTNAWPTISFPMC